MKLIKTLLIVTLSFFLLTGFSKDERISGVLIDKITDLESNNEINYLILKDEDKGKTKIDVDKEVFDKLSKNDDIVINEDGKVYSNGKFIDYYDGDQTPYYVLGIIMGSIIILGFISVIIIDLFPYSI
ncbi:hypothetical protein UFVDC4_00143 [Staphylococcus phage vB_SauM-UFV_DC4]|nr:hypothetical protein UFVDC4_00143 [Staphylococcus phage vB_SauM-UFV_DC4]